MNNLVLLEKENTIAVITLNRPEAMNALSRGLRDEFVEAFHDIQQDGETRVAIVTGNGRAFCAGFDLKELSNGLDQTADQIADNEMAAAMTAFEGPIIAAVNGHAITGGFELALACDIIISSTKAKFADTHARVGILPGWGLSQKLPRLIGLSRAKELSFTGNAIDAETAYQWGLVNRVVPPEELLSTTTSLATDMVSCVPQILKQYKRLINDGYSMLPADALKYEEKLGIESAKSASAAMVAMRKNDVIKRGREQNKTSIECK